MGNTFIYFFYMYKNYILCYFSNIVLLLYAVILKKRQDKVPKNMLLKINKMGMNKISLTKLFDNKF